MEKKDKRVSQDEIRREVRTGYARIAEGTGGCCGSKGSPEELARAIGYGEDELSEIPADSNMGLSCGNPTAVAELQAGQVVLDLGSGGGFDVFISARKVGPGGTAIGVDMTPEMLSRSRRAAAVFAERTGLRNVEFRLGEIEHLPVADGSVDVVISNCVINLSPDKGQVWREIARVLKPGGKACVSDLALKEALPEAVKSAAEALVGCISGAVSLEESLGMIEEAGLTKASVREKAYNVDIMEGCNDRLYRALSEGLPAGRRLGDYVVSVDITAYKGT